MMSKKVDIGMLLRREREQRGWEKQRVVDLFNEIALAKSDSKARSLQADWKKVHRWENGESSPRSEALEILCEVFGKPVEKWGQELSLQQRLCTNIRFSRNWCFTGREDILSRLHESFLEGKSDTLSQPYALSGLGGIGKTQIALEYAYRFRHEYETIMWAQASSHEALISDFTSFASLLLLSQQNQAEQQRIVEEVMQWLKAHKHWLLILDNVDDIEMASQFIPNLGGGHVLITTRLQAVGPSIKQAEVKKMDRRQGALLLLRRAKLLATDASFGSALLEDRQFAEAICDLIDGLPLALDQAGAYIEETGCSLSHYLALFRKEPLPLLKQRGTSSKKDYPDAVAATWEIAFKRIEQTSPIATDLLRFCTFMHPDAIPEKLLIAEATQPGSHLQTLADDPIALDDAIRQLCKYSLVRRQADNIVSIHRLVQTVLKDRMSKDEQRLWIEQAIRAVNQIFPSEQRNIELWPLYEQLLPHAFHCTALSQKWKLIIPEVSSLLMKTADYLQERNRFEEAEPFYQRALAIREQIMGPVHPDTARSLHNLASLYHSQGKYADAEPLYQRALGAWEQTVGPIHPFIAENLDNLAELYRNQSRYQEAEPLHRRALAILEQTYGPVHPDTARSLNRLAELYYTQERYTEGEELCRRALAIREQAVGPSHPDTAESLSNLAVFYFVQKKYEQAEAFGQRALAIWEQTRGPIDIQTAAGFNNLASVYRAQGKYAEAEQLYQRAVAVWEQTVGPSHAATARSLNALASLYRIQGKYTEARPLYQRALAIAQRTVGTEHPLTKKIIQEIAYFEEAQK